jgi:hypothetical protein
MWQILFVMPNAHPASPLSFSQISTIPADSKLFPSAHRQPIPTPEYFQPSHLSHVIVQLSSLVHPDLADFVLRSIFLQNKIILELN